MFQRLFNFFGYVKQDKSHELFKPLPLRVMQSHGGKNDVAALMNKNRIYIEKSREALPFHDVEFDTCVLPLIEFMAKYYLCLPASYDHHHRDSGGAFEHAIQTGVLSVGILNQYNEIYRKVESELRHEYQRTIPLAVYILGLTHDTGKPVADFFVRACDQDVNVKYDIPMWQATQETMYEWVVKNKVKYYKAFYDPNRINKKHDSYSEIAFARIDILLNLYQNPVLLKKQINEVLHQHDTEINNVISNIVKAGDRSSTRYYMESYGRIPRDNCNSSMFFEGLQSLYFSSDNSQHSFFSKPIFWSNSGLHIHYPNGLNAIYEAIIHHGKHLSNSKEDPADSLINILHNTNHLLLVGERSPKHCAIHTIYVEDIEISADGEEIKKWASALVVTIKQPHLLKLLEGARIYNSSYESPFNSENIPVEARGLNEDPQDYYKNLSENVHPEAQVDENIIVEHEEVDHSNDVVQTGIDLPTIPPTNTQQIEKSTLQTSEQDTISNDNLVKQEQFQLNINEPIVVNSQLTSEEMQRKTINQDAINTIANISHKRQNNSNDRNKNVADPVEIKKAAIEMLRSSEAENIDETIEVKNNKGTEHSQNNKNRRTTSDTDIPTSKEKGITGQKTKVLEKNQRKKHNKKISDLIRKHEFKTQEECDFVINIFLRVSYLISEGMIDLEGGDIIGTHNGNITLSKRFYASSHFNISTSHIIVEGYFYKGNYPVVGKQKSDYLIDDELSKLIIGNLNG